MHFVTVKAKINARGIYNATRANMVTSPNVQNLIALFDNKEIEIRVYGVNNFCFSATEQMIRDAWETYEADNFRLNDAVIDQLVNHFCDSNLSCSLPAFNVENYQDVMGEYKRNV